MEKEEKKQSKVWYIIAVIAFIVGMCLLLPKAIAFFSDLIFKARERLKKSDDEENWGPEIVRTSDLEEE